jgi:uncharacterized membrane protein
MGVSTSTAEGPASEGSEPRDRGVFARFLVGLGIGLAVALAVPSSVHLDVRVLAAWDVCVLIFMGLLVPILRQGHPETDYRRRRGVSGKALLVLVLAILASLVATGVMLTGLRKLSEAQRAAQLSLSVLAVFGTWLLMNVVFGFRYAALYYRQRREGATTAAVDFPGAESPGYSDFMYLGFAVGMTFGVTDTGLGSPAMRHLALWHSILSFWFNTAILALAINLASGLL